MQKRTGFRFYKNRKPAYVGLHTLRRSSQKTRRVRLQTGAYDPQFNSARSLTMAPPAHCANFSIRSSTVRRDFSSPLQSKMI